MDIFHAIKTMIMQYRSAKNRNLQWDGRWNDRLNPIDLAVLEATVSTRLRRAENSRISINTNDPNTQSQIQQEDNRIPAKPADVVKEILTETPTFAVADLKKQIKIVKKRISVLKEQGVSSSLNDERTALAYLEARQKYAKAFGKFKWPTSTFDAVKELLKKYKLHVVDLEDFCRHIPSEAIDEIEKYAKAYGDIRRDKPVFRLVIDDESFKEIERRKAEKRKKKDPILLALSPFGNWYYVLGAWDKEVLYIDDIIYKGK